MNVGIFLAYLKILSIKKQEDQFILQIKHSGPCINQESVPFEVFKNNAKDPLDCNGNPLRIDNALQEFIPMQEYWICNLKLPKSKKV